jgi:FdrA protein
MSITKYEIRQGAYFDSVVLMQLQRALVGLAGVLDAGAVMATPANKSLLAANDLLPADAVAGNDDLLIVVKGESETAVAAALDQVDELLKRRRSSIGQAFRPRSLAAAVDNLPEAQWVFISVPGRYAAGVAEEALDKGRHVFLYSDNVSLEDEVRLKQKARAKGLLLMGPDCGTAVINGVGLGFANRVRRGSIGLVAAAGTGLQAVASEIHNRGGGLSQAVGTGGRDLRAEVGAITAQQGLDLLGRDEATQVIVLISKPPSAGVTAGLLRAAQATGKPVVVNFIGFAPPGPRLGKVYFARGLQEAAETAVRLSEQVDQQVDLQVDLQVNTEDLAAPPPPVAGYVRGLFSGGTLAYETLLGLQSILTPLYSNIPIRPEQALTDLNQSQAHTILDLGEDEFTQGRLHPMLDNDLRLRRLRQETADPDTGYLILDLVLGEGAHPDPAAELAPAVAEAVQAGKQVLILVIGTDADPQGVAAQREQLQAAGAQLFTSVNAVVDYICRRLPRPAYDYPLLDLATFGEGLAVINVGLESFYESVVGQGGTAVQVDWRPPAGGNEKLMAILAKMKGG